MTDDRSPVVRLARAMFGDAWQAQLARELEMSASTIADWARGANEPRAATRLAILTLAGRRVSELAAAIAAFEASAPPRDGRAPKLFGEALDAAAALWRDLSISSSEVARRVGVHRTNLHKLFGPRRAAD